MLRIFDFIGSLVCHQNPQRTLFIAGIPLPLCARDTGIYLGIFIVLVYCLVRGRMKADAVPSTRISIVLALLMVPMMVDAVTSYISIRKTDNITRLVTGIFFGMSLAILLIPLASFKVYGVNKLKVVDGWADLIVLYVISISACVALLMAGLPVWIVSTAIIAGLIFLIARIIYTFICVLNIGKPASRVLYSFVLTLTAFGLLFIVKYVVLKNIVIKGL